MALDTDALIAAIDEARDSAYGSDEQSEISKKRAEALEYYFGLNVNPAPEGQSQVVDRSVYETVSTILPSLVRIFSGSSDEVCKFTPVGPEDEQGAQQTTAAVNHIVTQQNQWEQICADWIMDAALAPNAYCMAWWDESEKVIRETYEKQSDDQIAALLADKGVSVVEHSESIDEQATAEQQQAYEQAMLQWQQAAMQAQMQGQQAPMAPQPPQPVKLHDVVIERKENDGKICIKVLPPEHCFVSVNTPDWTLKDCPYFEYRQQKTIAELRAMGLDVDEDVSDNEDPDTEEDFARDRFGEDIDADGEGLTRRVWARMVWVEADIDGQSRMWYCIIVGRTVLYAEPCARIHVASMTAQPLPHRHPGMSIAETVKDLQDIRTAVKRGGLDNLRLANNGRHAISSRVNLADFLDTRPGGVVRMLDDSLPSEGHIVPLTHPVAFDSIIGTLEYFDQERQNRTGASRYFSGTDANAINKTASGTIALQNMASMRVEHIARMMAPAVENLFSIVHELLSKHQNKPLQMKLSGSWVTVDPQAWRTRRDVRISVGVGAGNKDSMMAQLEAVYMKQMQLLQLGMVRPEHLHATVTEQIKLAGFANPAKFFADPQTIQPPQPQPDPQVQVKQMELQADAQKFQAEQVMERERMSMQLEVDRNRQQVEAEQKALQIQAQKELEAFKSQLASDRERERLELDKYKADLDASVKLQIAGMNQQAKAISDARRESRPS